MGAHGYTVYLIDPDEAVHDALRTLLRTSGTYVKCFQSAEQFFDSTSALKSATGCILAESNLPGMGCLNFLRRLQINDANIPIIVLASTSDRAIAEQAVKAGALEVIEKPLVSDRLLDRLFPASCGCNQSKSNKENSAGAKSACNCNILKNN